MKNFRFAIMGAGKIANHFCHAVELIDGCEVVAIASKSAERAADFAERNHLPAAYADYEEMLIKEKPDCVYIAVTPHDHFRLSMMCLDHDVPVLCEKAMFRNSEEAETVFGRSKKQQKFVMEATWSRFLPAIKTAKKWIDEGQIGEVRYIETAIGFCAPKGDDNRYFNRELGGGAALDITIYGYELTRFMIDEPILNTEVRALFGSTGVDVTEHIMLRCEHLLAGITTSFVTNLEDRMVVYGANGKLIVPRPHVATEALLYNAKGELVEHFTDTETKNGFTYQIEETIDCIRSGKIESKVVPHELTIDCAKVFDLVEAQK